MEFRMDIQGLVEHKKTLDAMFIHAESGGSRSLSGGEKGLYNAVRRYMAEAETELRKITIANLGASMPNDPRGAHVSVSRDKVRSKKGLIFGQIKIYQPKTAGSKRTTYVPVRTLRPGQVGGNRRQRSRRTEQIMSYGPRDRGFILRWLETGTATRMTRYGNRGAITAHPRFGRAASAGVEQVAQELANKIERYMVKLFEKGTLANLD